MSVKIFLGCFQSKVVGVSPPASPLSSLQNAKVIHNQAQNLFQIELEEPFTATKTGTIDLLELLIFEMDQPKCVIDKLTAYADGGRTSQLNQGQLPSHL